MQNLQEMRKLIKSGWAKVGGWDLKIKKDFRKRCEIANISKRQEFPLTFPASSTHTLLYVEWTFFPWFQPAISYIIIANCAILCNSVLNNSFLVDSSTNQTSPHFHIERLVINYSLKQKPCHTPTKPTSQHTDPDSYLRYLMILQHPGQRESTPQFPRPSISKTAFEMLAS